MNKTNIFEIICLIIVSCIIVTIIGIFFTDTEENVKMEITTPTPKIIRELPINFTYVEKTKNNDDLEIEITVTEKELEMLAQTIYGEYRGIDKKQQAAVAWCILNRCDHLDESIEHVITTPWQFIGYSEFNPVTEEFYDMALDVVTRWEREKLGEENVGRVLPKDYMWFAGNGKENIYKNSYGGGQTWNWSLPDPYVEEE